MMKKKLVVCTLIAALIFTLGTFSLSYADELSDKQDELNQIKEEKKGVADDMNALVSDIKAQQAEVDKLQKSIEAKQAEVEAAIEDIKQTKRDIEERQQGLNQRLRTMYKNGSVGYLDVLLGSNSISEFLTNVEMIQRIYRNDQETLVVLEQQHRELEAKQTALENQREDLRTQKTEAQDKKAELQVQKEALQEKLDALNEEADRVSGEIASLQDTEKVYEGGAFAWPTTSSMITSPFGFRIHPITGIYTGHTGVDIGVGMGSPVYAAADGKVIVASYGYGGYGVAVVIDHGSGISTLYGHNSSLNVSVGQTVTRGQVIASSGSSGWSTGPHLHFEVRVGGSYVDPMSYF